MNKKAIISLYMSNWIIRAIFLAVMTVLVLFLVNYMSSAEVHAEHLRAESLAARILYSPNGLSYTDSDGRFHPKTVDLEKFITTDTVFQESPLLKDLIDFGEKQFIAAKLQLKDLENNTLICPLKSATCNDKALYYNKELFDQWILFSFDKNQFTKVDKQVYVLIWNKDKFVKGRLNIQVVTPVG